MCDFKSSPLSLPFLVIVYAVFDTCYFELISLLFLFLKKSILFLILIYF